MASPDSERPQLNAYGKLIVGCAFAGAVTLLVGGPGYLSAAFLGLAVVGIAVAMRRNARADDGRRRDDGDAGTDDTEMKAKAMAAGANGGDAGG